MHDFRTSCHWLVFPCFLPSSHSTSSLLECTSRRRTFLFPHRALHIPPGFSPPFYSWCHSRDNQYLFLFHILSRKNHIKQWVLSQFSEHPLPKYLIYRQLGHWPNRPTKKWSKVAFSGIRKSHCFDVLMYKQKEDLSARSQKQARKHHNDHNSYGLEVQQGDCSLSLRNFWSCGCSWNLCSLASPYKRLCSLEGFHELFRYLDILCYWSHSWMFSTPLL